VTTGQSAAAAVRGPETRACKPKCTRAIPSCHNGVPAAPVTCALLQRLPSCAVESQHSINQAWCRSKLAATSADLEANTPYVSSSAFAAAAGSGGMKDPDYQFSEASGCKRVYAVLTQPPTCTILQMRSAQWPLQHELPTRSRTQLSSTCGLHSSCGPHLAENTEQYRAKQ
jgi:hypothetical protein